MPLFAGSDGSTKTVDDAEKQPMEDRDTLTQWVAGTIRRGEMDAYQVKNNSRSLDGLGGLKAARRRKGEILFVEDMSLWLARTVKQKEAMVLGAVLAIVALRILSMLSSVLLPPLSNLLH